MFDELEVIPAQETFGGPMQMALDEVLLGDVRRPTLRFYRWDGSCVTFGYFQRLDMIRGLHPGYPVVRRWTGGGIVVHEGDLTFSLAVPPNDRASALPSSLFYRELHGALGGLLGGRLAGVGDLTEGPSCFQAPSRDDVMVGAEKILGGAIRRSRGALLYQGSLKISSCLGGGDGFPGRFADVLGRATSFRGVSGQECSRACILSARKYASEAWNALR